MSCRGFTSNSTDAFLFLFNASDARDFDALNMDLGQNPAPTRRDGGRIFDSLPATEGQSSTPAPAAVGSLPLHHSHPPRTK